MTLRCTTEHGKPDDLFHVINVGNMIIAKCLNCGAEYKIADVDDTSL